MTLVMVVPGRHRPDAILRIICHTSHKLHVVGDTSGGEIVPYQGSPASDLGDTVPQRHCSMLWLERLKRNGKASLSLLIFSLVCANADGTMQAKASSNVKPCMVQDTAKKTV